MKFLKFILVTPLILLFGCASTEVNVEPEPYDNAKSYAYNVVNQTGLTKHYMSQKSPLKDFTENEKNEAVEAFKEKTNASSMAGLGVFNILTGDPLSGALALGGSGLLAISSGKHFSRFPTWIISVPKENFNSPLQAQQFIVNQIKTATVNTLSKYGNTKEIQKTINSSTINVQINGEWLNAHGDWNNTTEILLTERLTQLPNFKESLSYTYGFSNEIFSTQESLLSFFNPILIVNALNNETTFDEIINDITKQLPEGFYLYYPPYPVLVKDKVRYYNTKNPLPTIYTQGKKYEFIKP